MMAAGIDAVFVRRVIAEELERIATLGIGVGVDFNLESDRRFVCHKIAARLEEALTSNESTIDYFGGADDE